MTTPPPSLRATAFEQHPTTPGPGPGGTASFAVGDTTLRWLHVAWHLDPTDGLAVDALGGDAMSLYGGDLPLTAAVAAAILDSIEDATTPLT